MVKKKYGLRSYCFMPLCPCTICNQHLEHTPSCPFIPWTSFLLTHSYFTPLLKYGPWGWKKLKDSRAIREGESIGLCDWWTLKVRGKGNVGKLPGACLGQDDWWYCSLVQKMEKKNRLGRKDDRLSSYAESELPVSHGEMCRGKIVLRKEIWIKNTDLECILCKWELKPWEWKDLHRESHGVRRRPNSEFRKNISSEEETGREKCLWRRLGKNCQRSRRKIRRMLCHKMKVTSQCQIEQRSQIRWGLKRCSLLLAIRSLVIWEKICLVKWEGWKVECSRMKTR